MYPRSNSDRPTEGMMYPHSDRPTEGMMYLHGNSDRLTEGMMYLHSNSDRPIEGLMYQHGKSDRPTWCEHKNCIQEFLMLNFERPANRKGPIRRPHTSPCHK